VLFTGEKSQLVVMHIPAGGEVGMEVHAHVEQSLFIHTGEGVAILDGEETPVKAGDVVTVTPGTNHNIENRSDADLKIFTIYAPPNHIDGRIHKTKADADADTEDEAFGEAVK
jgi:mannose-6-phosphate isomerase-like protein (cupin superfamily)